tara:strand:- start:696 stop:995 length:300 start_codon:yes stop_codon:yes gene_type:complete
MNVKDFKLDQDGDLEISGGDFYLNESDQVHIEHILKSNKGYWLEEPLLGVGIISELNGNKTKQELKQNIRRQLVFDNYNVKEVNISDEFKIGINATRKI